MKNIFVLLCILVLFTRCQFSTDKKTEKAKVLVIVPAIQKELYDRPSVKGLGIALVQP